MYDGRKREVKARGLGSDAVAFTRLATDSCFILLPFPSDHATTLTLCHQTLVDGRFCEATTTQLKRLKAVHFVPDQTTTAASMGIKSE